jgi:predicted nicotinamide N-methyase
VPEVRLFLAVDPIVLWARLEAAAGRALPAPYWASAWIGGQVLARHVLDHPATVAGLRVLDIASGSGVVAIAAALAGASAVVANDIDPCAVGAIGVNARLNRVRVARVVHNMLDGDGGDADVVLAGDALYDRSIAERVMPFLMRAAARGARVLVGQPVRRHAVTDVLDVVADYHIPGIGVGEDSILTTCRVLTVRGG